MNRGVRPSADVMSTGSTKPLKWFATSSTGRSPRVAVVARDLDASEQQRGGEPTHPGHHASHGGQSRGRPGAPHVRGRGPYAGDRGHRPRTGGSWRSRPRPRRCPRAGHAERVLLPCAVAHAGARPAAPGARARGHRGGGVLHPLGVPRGAAARGARRARRPPGSLRRLLAAAHRPHPARLSSSRVAGAVAIGIATVEGVSGWFKQGLLVDSWFRDGGGSGLRVSWTLVVEVAFYAVILPLAAVVGLASRRSLDAWIVACLALMSVRLVGARAHHAAPHRPLGARAPPYLPAFGAGMLLAVAELGTPGMRGSGGWCARSVGSPRGLRLCWGLGGGRLRRHGGAARSPHDCAGVRPRARAAGAVVPAGHRRGAGPGSARAAHGGRAVPVEPGADGARGGLARVLPVAPPGAARGAAAAPGAAAARVLGLALAMLGAFLAGEAAAGGWRRRRAGPHRAVPEAWWSGPASIR